MKSKKIQVYAVVRWDRDLVNPQDAFTIKEILPEMTVAAKEVERLNHLNSDKKVIYFMQTTRFYPDWVAE